MGAWLPSLLWPLPALRVLPTLPVLPTLLRSPAAAPEPNKTPHQPPNRDKVDRGRRSTGAGRGQGGGRAGAASRHAGVQIRTRARNVGLDPDLVLDPPLEVQAGRVLQVEQPKQRTIPGSDPTHLPPTRHTEGQARAEQVLEVDSVCGILVQSA